MNAVTADIVLEVRRRNPSERPSVGEILWGNKQLISNCTRAGFIGGGRELTSKSVNGHNIGGRTTKEEKGHGARARRLRLLLAMRVLESFFILKQVLTVQVTVYGVPTGTTSLRPGFEIGFPWGFAPTGAVQAAANETRALEARAKNEDFILAN